MPAPTTTAWSSFYPACLSELPGIPLAMLDHWLRNVAVEFCERTKSWVVDLTPMDTVAEQMPYAITVPTDSELVDIRSVWYKGIKIEPKSPYFLEEKYGDWQAEVGSPAYYTQQSSDDVQLVPAPNAVETDAIKIKVSLRPADDATGLDNWLYVGWNKKISAGAKGRLMAMDKKPWTNPTLAAFYLQQFEDAVLSATSSSSMGQVRARPRSKPMFA